MSEMFFAYLVQEFLQVLFKHYFLFLSIIYRLFGLQNLLESRDSSISYNQPLQKEQIQCFQKLIMDRQTGLSPLQENAGKPSFRGPPRPERASSFGTAKINVPYCCCSRVQAWWLITWASFRAWGTVLKRSSGSLSTGKQSLVSSTVKVVPLPDGL